MDLIERPRRLLRQFEPLIVQIQAIHDLVVIIPGHRLARAGEGRGESPLKINQSAPRLVEEVILRRVVKRIVIVRDDAPPTAMGPGEC